MNSCFISSMKGERKESRLTDSANLSVIVRDNILSSRNLSDDSRLRLRHIRGQISLDLNLSIWVPFNTNWSAIAYSLSLSPQKRYTFDLISWLPYPKYQIYDYSKEFQMLALYLCRISAVEWFAYINLMWCSRSMYQNC